jgi:HD superfamily phosphodiesterase
MRLQELLEKAESDYKNKIEVFFSHVFRQTFLPSHDLTHHKRVWNWAKELLNSLNLRGIEVSGDLTLKLLIGCYLHDSGMAVDKGDRHGVHSRLFCTRFLENNDLNISEFHDLLEVVEHHDDKGYNETSGPEELSTLLSVADDLDAFGKTGIYRYSEIYLERNKDLRKLGYLVLENVAGRYQHFIETFGYDKELVKRELNRYKEVENFFIEYNRQSKDYEFGGKSISGNCGVIEVIASTIKPGPYTFDDIIHKGMCERDETIRIFYRKLSLEI